MKVLPAPAFQLFWRPRRLFLIFFNAVNLSPTDIGLQEGVGSKDTVVLEISEGQNDSLADEGEGFLKKKMFFKYPDRYL